MYSTLHSVGGVQAAAVLLRVVAEDLLLAQYSAPRRGGVAQVLGGDVPRQPEGRLRRGRGRRPPVVRRRPAVQCGLYWMEGCLEMVQYILQ